MWLKPAFAIAAGAGLGALARYGLGLGLNALFPAIPPGTLVANLLGAWLIGAALVLFATNPGLAPEWRLFVITGFLGALTTFSTFSAEVTHLLQQGRLALAGGAIALHVLGSLAMTLFGMTSATAFKRVLGG